MASYRNKFNVKFNRFLSNSQLMQYIIIFITLFNLSYCLYEDQVGKFDWKKNFIGKIKFSNFHSTQLIVATEENVIANLNWESGHIIWRHIFEQGKAGEIRAMQSIDGAFTSDLIVTISGGVPVIVRVWNIYTGHIVTEWSMSEQNPDRIDNPFLSFSTMGLYSPERLEDVKWHIKDGTLYHILPIYDNGVEVTSYDCKTGEKLNVTTISATFITKDIKCELAAPYLACLKGDDNLTLLFLVNIFNSNVNSNPITMNSILGPGAQGPFYISSVKGHNAPAISITADNNKRKRIIVFNKIKDANYEVISRDIDGRASLYIATQDGYSYILFEMTADNEKIDIMAYELFSSTHLSNMSMSLSHMSLESPEIISSMCPMTNEYKCVHLLTSEDHKISFFVHNDLIWQREESLAKIVNVEILELPMSDRDLAIETEFNQKERDIVSMFIRRISSQINQAKSMLQSMMMPEQTNQRAGLVRDKFGLHKMIVVVTSIGKMFGIDTKTGDIVWQLRVKNIRGLTANSNKMILYVQRGSRHFPRPSQCALLAADKTTGNGVIYIFDPISGQPLGEILKLNYKIKQTTLLHVPTDDFIRSILILDEHEKVHIFPENALSVATSISKSTYIFTANPSNGILSGFSLYYSTTENLIVDKVWELVLSPKNQKIVQVISKNPIERVHSQGRVLSDRSVLYKYINPNLVAIVTQGVGNTQKDTISLYLLDVVSGTMIFSIVHKKAREPIHVVHSENWLVYSYYNKKSRRTEIATLELYEGKTQSNTTAFSSLMNSKLPIVERQAYIFPADIESMRETITEKGITSKHILVSLANGGIYEMPWMLVDPRRPINPELREEDVIPYVPELPIMMNSIINYNQSIFRTTGIYTSPSGLESTCLVFVYGLDLFYTRVAPSKTFDVLKEDFDYYLIVIVLSALMAASYVTKKLASQKVQKQAWK